MSESISLENISASQLKLQSEDVLVRPVAAEEKRASGLVIPVEMQKAITGGVWYGTVVAVGPGRRVYTPSLAAIKAAAFATLSEALRGLAEFSGDESARLYADEIAKNAVDLGDGALAPLPWKPGESVAVRQGFGVEVELREGRHWIVGRGAMEHGHGILCSWSPEHVHCLHAPKWANYDPGEPDGKTEAECCGCEWTGVVESALPGCGKRTPRVAEAVLGHEVFRMKIESGQGAGFYEERPIDDGREDV